MWVFEITGDPSQTSSFWVAQRIPEGHVVAVANNFIIREVDCEDRANFRCSTDLYTKAKAAGAWDGEGKFDWARVMALDIRTNSYMAGFPPIPLYTTARLWRVFTRVSPSLDLQLTNNP